MILKSLHLYFLKKQKFMFEKTICFLGFQGTTEI